MFKRLSTGVRGATLRLIVSLNRLDSVFEKTLEVKWPQCDQPYPSVSLLQNSSTGISINLEHSGSGSLAQNQISSSEEDTFLDQGRIL